MTVRSELRLTDSDIVGARQRFAIGEAEKPDIASAHVPSQVTMILFFGSPIVWASIWGASFSAVLTFSAWQSLQTPNAGTEFVEWTVAFLMSLGPLTLGLTAGFLAAAPLVRRGYWFFGVLALVLLLSCGVFAAPLVKAKLPAQSPSVAAKEQMIWNVVRTLRVGAGKS